MSGVGAGLCTKGVGLVGVLVVMMGCTLDVAFTQDRRLEIVAPEPRSTVEVPFRVEWRVRDFEIRKKRGNGSTNEAGYFALFLDRRPIRPGQSLRAVAGEDEACLRAAGCPDEDYLNERNIFTTVKTEFAVETIPDRRSSDRQEDEDWHEVTIILVDPLGNRIGESAFSVDFVVERNG